MSETAAPAAAPQWISRACPVCERRDAIPWLQKDGLRLVRCDACSMVFANPVPATFASGEYYTAAGADYYLLPAKLESDYAAVRFERELRLLRKHCPTGAILDVGCSSGAFLYQLNERFPKTYRILGTDVSGAPLDYAESRGVPVVRGDFLKCDFRGATFDAVTFWAVMEHLVEPKLSLQKARSLLKPGGFCFILVPNLESLAIRLLGAKYRYIYPQHVNYFTRKSLLRMCGDGFEPVETGSTHFNPLVIWLDWWGDGRDVSNRERADLLQQTTAWKQRPLLKPARALYRAVERVLGACSLADNLVVVLRKSQD